MNFPLFRYLVSRSDIWGGEALKDVTMHAQRFLEVSLNDVELS